MSEDLNRLKEIGAQKIYEDTHIALKHVQSVIHESFEGLNRVQFMGFISILEREYRIDLSQLKKDGIAYFDSTNPKENINQGVFVSPKRTKKFTLVYIIIAVILFALVAFFSLENQDTSEVTKLDDTTIESVQKTMEPKDLIKPLSVKEDINNTNLVDTNMSVSATPVVEKTIEEVVEEKKAIVPQSLQIKPLSKLWIGYIDAKKRVKKQSVIKKTLSLDPTKEWLLSLGHGNVEIEIDGKVQKFHSTQSVRFIYKDGKLKQLSIDEFKKLNKGRLW
jgi:hypothetical protein